MERLKYSKGTWEIAENNLGCKDIVIGKDDPIFALDSTPCQLDRANIGYTSGLEDEATDLGNATLICATVNACAKAYPDNPIAVADMIPHMIELVKAIKAYQKDGLNRWDWIQSKVNKIASDLGNGVDNMNKELGFARHLILYSKGWYKKSDNHVDDLKTMMSKYAALDKAYIRDYDLVKDLVQAVIIYCNKHDLEDFLMGCIFGTPRWHTIFDTHLKLQPISLRVNELLGILSIVQIKNDNGTLLLDIGEPDFNLLPEPQKQR